MLEPLPRRGFQRVRAAAYDRRYGDYLHPAHIGTYVLVV